MLLITVFAALPMPQRKEFYTCVCLLLRDSKRYSCPVPPSLTATIRQRCNAKIQQPVQPETRIAPAPDKCRPSRTRPGLWERVPTSQSRCRPTAVCEARNRARYSLGRPSFGEPGRSGIKGQTRPRIRETTNRYNHDENDGVSKRAGVRYRHLLWPGRVEIPGQLLLVGIGCSSFINCGGPAAAAAAPCPSESGPPDPEIRVSPAFPLLTMT